ncbi:LPS export ABC transporter periplasmic protein LptC [Rhodobium gokarnense]|uniref:Lipopolysaccharide export system protein LptC n=1 Tax=Rhodobium gokarnense TaxID=364296 RepID=A0ABT3HGX9_9HYPH|nr:LPS export ABC transporter periplasmic protein LptC [Rhodobium gokarnense]MCW2309653.1 lipopolysaccharide export system protein LptC [Rhodobium gokarnense]
MTAHPTTADSPAPLATRQRERARVDAVRHSRRVRRLKIVLPSVAAVIVAVIAGMVVISSFAPGIDLSALSFGGDGIVMANPRLSGHDKQNRSYEVTADRAVQSLANPKIITMEKIGARVELGDGSWATFRAVEGVFDGTKETLSLTDRITIDSSLGYQATLDGAEVNFKDGVVTSADPFSLTSEKGTIEAGRLEVKDDGQTILFGDGIKMTLNPAAGEKLPKAVSSELKEAAKTKRPRADGAAAPAASGGEQGTGQ